MRNNVYKRYNLCEQPATPTGRGPTILLKLLLLGVLFVLFPLLSQAQNRAVSGKVTDSQGTALPGVTVLIPGTATGTSSGSDGSFELQVPEGTTKLSISFVGYATQVLDITGKSSVQVALKDDAQALGDVVVVGYGTVRKSDLTGAVSSLASKDFNKGTYTSPDQLIQGRTSGVQVTQNSGQPGGAATIKIRGNSAVTGTGQPLYVVDGVQLDGRSARPGLNTAFGDSPDSNPLNFLNPADIESIDVLKDASATAIYGSRGAYGVVIITTKRGKAGEAKLDVNISSGFSNIMRRIKVLNASEYRQALTYYGASQSNDKGQSNDALGAILQTGAVQNYNTALSGGSENARYRLSLGYLDQQGIIKKTGFQKFSTNFVTNVKLLESKRLGFDVNISASQSREQLAPITNNGDFRGSLIGQALQWNPTDSLYSANGQPVSRIGSSIINPVAQQEYYNDNSRVSTALASISPYYKFTDWLEYRALLAVNYSTGLRRTSIDQRLNVVDYQRLGYAALGTSELQTQQMTHTLNFNRKLGNDLNVTGLLGYEYTRFNYSGTNLNGRGPVDAAGNPIGFGTYGLDYTNYLQFSNPSGRSVSSFVDPVSELQSFFGRATLNYKGRYLLTATLRRDGSTKFGDNNKYGYFPSVSAAWDVSQEDFFKADAISQLKFRVGYGRTGNQEFPAGASRKQFSFLPNSNGGTGQITNDSPNLKWQADAQTNVGVDIALFNNRVTLTADYFYKKTTDLLYPTAPIQPAAPGGPITWQNLQGAVINKGVELIAGVTAVETPRFGVSFTGNATFIKNTVQDLPGVIQTGALSGQGLSGVTVEVIQSGLPINAFFTQEFKGIDANGQSMYTDGGVPRYLGNPNPTALAGLSTTVRYQKLSLTANLNGVFGNVIYNNTFNSVLNVSQIQSGKNIALANYQAATKESLSNRLAPSSRFLESGNYVKLTNVTLSYALGNFGKAFKGASIYAIGQNLFVITKYSGFDPEVNTNKTVGGVPSAGIDYTGYPTARTFTFGVNFSL